MVAETGKIFSLEDKEIRIPFSKIFDRNLEHLEKFSLKKKRTYVNIVNDILEQNNMLIEKDKDKTLITAYLYIKFLIDTKAFNSKEELRNEIYSKIINDRTLGYIKEIVEENYKFNLDQEVNKKFNPGLQFTNHHNKLLLTISMATKFIIPLITHYLFMNPNEKDISEFLLYMYDPLFVIDDTVDLWNKLYEAVFSRVVTTRYSDHVFWSTVKILGRSIQDLTTLLTKKLIIDIIPKYIFSQNPISLNHVFINNNIGYTLRLNFLNFSPINLTKDGVTY